jgi:hypothetical protein
MCLPRPLSLPVPRISPSFLDSVYLTATDTALAWRSAAFTRILPFPSVPLFSSRTSSPRLIIWIAPSPSLPAPHLGHVPGIISPSHLHNLATQIRRPQLNSLPLLPIHRIALRSTRATSALPPPNRRAELCESSVPLQSIPRAALRHSCSAIAVNRRCLARYSSNTNVIYPFVTYSPSRRCLCRSQLSTAYPQ